MPRKRGRPVQISNQEIARMRLKRSIGATVKEIAEEMGYSPYTVSKYTKDIAAGFLDRRNGGKPDIFR